MPDTLTSGPEPQETQNQEQTVAEPKTSRSIRAALLEAAGTLEKRAEQRSAEAARIRTLVAALDENPAVVPAFEAWAQDMFRRD